MKYNNVEKIYPGQVNRDNPKKRDSKVERSSLLWSGAYVQIKVLTCL